MRRRCVAAAAGLLRCPRDKLSRLSGGPSVMRRIATNIGKDRRSRLAGRAAKDSHGVGRRGLAGEQLEEHHPNEEALKY